MWITKNFSDLTTKELHAIYSLRIQVFVVEQNCPYQEVDENDLDCLHLYKIEDGKIIAYARVIAEDEIIRIGRIAVHPSERKKGLGKELVNFAIDVIQKRNPSLPIHIQAQAYLLNFYQSFGFHPISEIYLEDNIPHLDMILTIPKGGSAFE